MEVEIITSDKFRTNSWSGGTTTELFIYPVTADYKLRNFQFRLSTATVEREKTDFSRLPGVSRKLILLDGQVTVNHEARYSRQLRKFDIEEFEGDWITSSEGKCTDFNLMTTGKTRGKLSAIVIEKGLKADSNISVNCDFCFIYIYSGRAEVILNGSVILVNRGDLLKINKPDDLKFEIEGLERSELVISEINL